uniref:Uncharacterized protein n=1 Tax=viral metagenome TaxID=1070528 RepID=A0A6C0AZM5_9ZZZZ
MKLSKLSKLSNLYIFTILVSKCNASLLPAKKISRDCRHFIGDTMECGKFGVANLVTGKITYDSARSARENEKICGQDTTHFEEKYFKIITVPYYFFKDNVSLIIPTGLIISSTYFYLYTLFHTFP